MNKSYPGLKDKRKEALETEVLFITDLNEQKNESL